MRAWRFRGFDKHLCIGFLFGQGISLLQTGTGVFSGLLERGGRYDVDGIVGLSAPALQNAVAYGMIFGVYAIVWVYEYLACRRGLNRAEEAAENLVERTGFWAFEDKLRFSLFKVPVTRYALVSALDVSGNMLLVTAFRFTSITSVTILNVCTIPGCVVLSYFFLRMRYQALNYAGIAVCVSGVVVIVLSDYFWLSGDKESTQGQKLWLGDILVVLGCMCYATTNVSQEYLVKDHDRVEYLFLVSFFGLIYTGIISGLSEVATIQSATWSSDLTGFLIGYGLCLFLMYALVSKYLQIYDATLFNLSLLSSNIWAMLAGIFVFKDTLNAFYFFSLGLIAVGILIYSYAPPYRQITEGVIGEEDEVLNKSNSQITEVEIQTSQSA